MSRQVFISHASADAGLAQRMCDGLESRGISCWIAPRDVQFDGTYGTEIMNGLRECPVFLLVVTDAASASQQVEREAERAAHYKKRIVPVVVGQSVLGPRLEFYGAGRQQLRCPSSPDEGFLDGLASAVTLERTRPTTPPHVSPGRPPARRTLILAMVAALIAAVASVSYFVSRTSPSSQSAVEPESPAVEPGPIQEVPPRADIVPKAPAGIDTPKRVTPVVPSEKATAVPAPPGPSVPAPVSSAAPLVPAGAAEAVVVSGARLRFAAIPAGHFVMGCQTDDAACDDDEKPTKRVSVEAFSLSTTEVSQEFWEAVMGSNPSDFKGATLPVEHVSWQDAQGFVDRLNQRQDGFLYRLPTEAEWEYAARASDSAPRELSAVAWFDLSTTSSRPSRPQSVATKAANRWGLYDMLGNVAEWCQDWYSPNYQRVVRGGSWVDSARSLRVSARGKAVPSTRDYSLGLRLVRQSQ